MDTTAFAWQEWPVSKTQYSEAGEMSTGHCPQSPRMQDFPESDTTQGWQGLANILNHMYVFTSRLVHDYMSPSLLLIGQPPGMGLSTRS